MAYRRMDETRRDVLRKSTVLFKMEMTTVSDVVDHLYSNSVLTEPMRNEIMSGTTNGERAVSLHTLIPKRGETAFDAYYVALQDTDNLVLAGVLEPHLYDPSVKASAKRVQSRGNISSGDASVQETEIKSPVTSPTDDEPPEVPTSNTTDAVHTTDAAHTTEATTASAVSKEFKVGEKVKVELGRERFQALQEGHGGWTPEMYIGKIATVQRIDDQGVFVQYMHDGLKFCLNPKVLTKAQLFSVNDVVRISGDVSKVKREQEGHGGWIEPMRRTLNKEGRVVKVYDSEDLLVKVQGRMWMFNPSCCVLVRHGAEEIKDTLSDDDDDDHDGGLDSLRTMVDVVNQLFKALISNPVDGLVKEAAIGNTEAVRDIVTKFPDKVDERSSNLTALHVACHQGHKEIVQILLTAGAQVDVQDDDGDTPLILSAFRNFPEIIELLLVKGADNNIQNRRSISALHMAVNKKHSQCVKVLLKHQCNANIQDGYGDTPLHDAIARENREITELMVNYPGINFTLKNNRGFNLLHQAAILGSNLATEEILKKCRQIVDVKKEDGYTALHLAAFNNHKEVCETLLSVGQADINSRTNQRSTPLLLAVSQGYLEVVILLVSKGADLSLEDQDGDTCLHLALMRHQFTTEIETAIPILKTIRTEMNMTQNESQAGADIACYLAQNGASLTHRNRLSKTPLDLVVDTRIKEAILHSARDRSLQQKD